MGRKSKFSETANIKPVKNALFEKLNFKQLPKVYSSYLKLPEEQHKSITDYVEGVRSNLIAEIGDNITQIQMSILDRIINNLIYMEFLSVRFADNPEQAITDKTFASSLSTYQSAFTKSIQQFYSFAIMRGDDVGNSEADKHLKAITGGDKARVYSVNQKKED